MAESKDDKPQRKRATNAELELIHADIMKMMIRLDSTRGINEYIQKTYGKSRSSAVEYIKKAREAFKAEASKDFESERERQKQFLLVRITESLAKASSAESEASAIKFETMCQSWYDKFLRLFPNGLQPETVDNDQALNITFNALPPQVKVTQEKEKFKAPDLSGDTTYREFKIHKNKAGIWEITDLEGNIKKTTVNPQTWIDAKLDR